MVLVTIENTQIESKCMSSWALISRHWMMVDFSFIKLYWSKKSWKKQGWSIIMGCHHPLSLILLLWKTIMVLRIRDIRPTGVLLLYGYFYILQQSQDYISPLLFTIAPGLHITTRHHMRRPWRGYVVNSKVPRTILWCFIHPINWWWIVMLIQILKECEEMKKLDTLFMIRVGPSSIVGVKTTYRHCSL